LRGNIDIVRLFTNFKTFEESLNSRIEYVIVYSQGSLNYEDVLSMTDKRFNSIEKLIGEKVKMMIQLRGMV
jgi:hypothetical protein